jgi:uncharacterized Fe-S cluster-containing radical SAM superfamily protein
MKDDTHNEEYLKELKKQLTANEYTVFECVALKGMNLEEIRETTDMSTIEIMLHALKVRKILFKKAVSQNGPKVASQFFLEKTCKAHLIE